MTKYNSKNILIVGMGKSGFSSAKAMKKEGANVFAYDDREYSCFNEEQKEFIDRNDIECFFGKNKEITRVFDFVIISPGVPIDNIDVVFQIENGAKILGELELAYSIAKGEFIAITGTNGKTTTTSLVGLIFNLDEKDTRVVGNIGDPVIDEACNSNEKTYFVTEVSSFQLESTENFKPKVSAILNITPDHLDRHKTMENYGTIKAKISANQDEKDFVIINQDDPALENIITNEKVNKVFFTKEAETSVGVFVREQNIYVKNLLGKVEKIIPIDEIPLPGTHNLENVLAACAICYFAGIDINKIKEGITNFMGVEHRVEVFFESNGIKFVNDSKGTNPDATIKALEAMKNNIILIAGGYDKGADFKELLTYGKDKIKAMYLIGETKSKIKKQANDLGYLEVYECDTLEECVKHALECASKGDKVLLSPACASWGMYTNYEERGKKFKEEVVRNYKTI